MNREASRRRTRSTNALAAAYPGCASKSSRRAIAPFAIYVSAWPLSNRTVAHQRTPHDPGGQPPVSTLREGIVADGCGPGARPAHGASRSGSSLDSGHQQPKSASGSVSLPLMGAATAALESALVGRRTRQSGRTCTESFLLDRPCPLLVHLVHHIRALRAGRR